jgi:hypothetical protein
LVFATLDEVSPRDAWSHEAQVFTPWLAKNLDRLSKAIGLPLDLEQSEAKVGRYAADILARNSQDGSAVLIENQLEFSDHTHLGQIMTYLTGLEAKTVVWVAPWFRDEHLSAIGWLNEHTVDPFAFFAVRVRVVRIGDSPLAPLFEVLARPNNWDRRIQEVVREAREPSAVVAQRGEFWARFRSETPTSELLTGGPAGSSLWRPVAGTDLVLSLFLSKDGVGVFVRGRRGTGGEAIVSRISALSAALESVVGAPLGDPRYPFNKKLFIDTGNRANWPEMIAWLSREGDLYSSALAAHADRLSAVDEGV